MTEFTVKPEDIENDEVTTTKLRVPPILKAIHAAYNGEHVAIICRNAHDQREKFDEALKDCAPYGGSGYGRTITFKGKGSIEFVTISSRSERAIHDFDWVQISPKRPADMTDDSPGSLVGVWGEDWI